jgi:hypothetical protein
MLIDAAMYKEGNIRAIMKVDGSYEKHNSTKFDISLQNVTEL